MKIFETGANFLSIIVLLFLIIGVTAGALENKPFAPGPALAFFLRLAGRVELATDLATGRKEPSDRPFTGLVEDRANDIKKETDKFLDNIPKTQDGQMEVRALSCPNGSYSNDIPQVPASRLPIVKDGQLQFLWDVQARWGNPHCVAGKEWRYFFDNGATAIATESGNKVNVQIIGTYGENSTASAGTGGEEN